MSQELSSMSGGFDFGKKSGGDSAPKSDAPSAPKQEKSAPPKSDKKSAPPKSDKKSAPKAKDAPKKAPEKKKSDCACHDGPKRKISFEMNGKKFGGFVVDRDGGKLDAVLTCDEDFAVVKGSSKENLAADLKKAAKKLGAVKEDVLASPEDAKKASSPDGTRNDNISADGKKKKKKDGDGLSGGKKDLMDKKAVAEGFGTGPNDPSPLPFLDKAGWTYEHPDEWISPDGSSKVQDVNGQGSYSILHRNGKQEGPFDSDSLFNRLNESVNPRDQMKKFIKAVTDVRGTPRIRL